MSTRLGDLELAKKQVQIEIIRSCIANSKRILIGCAAKQALRNAMFFTARFSRVLPSEKYLREVDNEYDNAILELKRIVAIALQNLVKHNHINSIYIDDYFWFSTHDLKSGYILLYPSPHIKFADHIMFLVEVKDPLDGTIYLPGDIVLFKKANHVLQDMRGLSESELGIGFNYVGRSEMLSELSKLQSTIKSINYGTITK